MRTTGVFIGHLLIQRFLQTLSMTVSELGLTGNRGDFEGSIRVPPAPSRGRTLNGDSEFTRVILDDLKDPPRAKVGQRCEGFPCLGAELDTPCSAVLGQSSGGAVPCWK